MGGPTYAIIRLAKEAVLDRLVEINQGNGARNRKREAFGHGIAATGPVCAFSAIRIKGLCHCQGRWWNLGGLNRDVPMEQLAATDDY